MDKQQTVRELTEAVERCRVACATAGEPFHADALAAHLGLSYEELRRQADGHGVSRKRAAMLTAALAQCTASVVACALASDPKSHGLWMFYLRNRAGFADRQPAAPAADALRVTFVGEDGLKNA